ncbi:cache domain-containing protein [Malonomonas rubra]|uniref:cache domain-containing protein n=1 Tax=Malonomonas rubra TaxID=57040 RepID=UPI0026EFDB78|nr:cache domain-containing protein [Malonomonas rubra]
MKRSLKAFIILSVVIAILEIASIALSFHQQKLAFEEHLRNKIEQVRSALDLTLVGIRQRMVGIANYVVQSPEIQQTFLDGRRAVVLEGGGAGGEEAAKYREKLLRFSQGVWKQLNASFTFLGMHYQLPGKVTSFLRVHEPEKYGDLLVPFRYILREAHEKKAPVSGLEIGRQGLFIRGIAPVFAYDAQAGKEIYVGSLEISTSLQQAIENLALNKGLDVAVLLDLALLDDVVWPERLQEMVNHEGGVANFLISEVSSPGVRKMLQGEHLKTSLDFSGMSLHEHEENSHWLAAFPLRDYWGEQDKFRPPIGLVVISTDATASYNLLQTNLRNNIFIAVASFLIIEILLWWVLQFTANKLERMVEAGRKQLEVQKDQLEVELAAKEKLQRQSEELIGELIEAMENVKALSGLLPICSYCKKIRDDEGYWQRLEAYIETHSDAQFSHGICQDCLEEHFPEVKKDSRYSHMKEGTLPRK